MKGDYYRFLVDVSMVSQRQAPTMQKERKTVEVPKVPPEQVQERIVEETGVPVPRVMEETIEVEELKSQHFEGESTLLADNKLTSRLDGSCAAQAPEWEELQRLRAEGLVAIRDINKLLNDCDELIPEWLNVVKGVVDSEDLPLNIYRETLQQNKILRVIQKNHVMKCMDMFAEIAEKKDDYEKSFEQFVKCMKLGIRENSVDDFEIAELLRFNTSKSGDEQISFKEYVVRMKEGQNDNYHITGESIAVVSYSSFWEYWRKNGYEVLYVADPVDEYAVQQLKEFDGTKLKPTTKEGLDLGDQVEKKTLEELKTRVRTIEEVDEGGTRQRERGFRKGHLHDREGGVFVPTGTG